MNQKIPQTKGIYGDLIRICIHQFDDCKYQSSYGDGAIFICNLNKDKCILKDENSISSTR